MKINWKKIAVGSVILVILSVLIGYAVKKNGGSSDKPTNGGSSDKPTNGGSSDKPKKANVWRNGIVRKYMGHGGPEPEQHIYGIKCRDKGVENLDKCLHMILDTMKWNNREIIVDYHGNQNYAVYSPSQVDGLADSGWVVTSTDIVQQHYHHVPTIIPVVPKVATGVCNEITTWTTSSEVDGNDQGPGPLMITYPSVDGCKTIKIKDGSVDGPPTMDPSTGTGTGLIKISGKTATYKRTDGTQVYNYSTKDITSNPIIWSTSEGYIRTLTMTNVLK